MSLARDEHHITWLRLLKGHGNGLFTIEFHRVLQLAASLQAGKNILHNLLRIFTPRIV
jgi:hypothetical protein